MKPSERIQEILQKEMFKEEHGYISPTKFTTMKVDAVIEYLDEQEQKN